MVFSYWARIDKASFTMSGEELADTHWEDVLFFRDGFVAFTRLLEQVESRLAARRNMSTEVSNHLRSTRASVIKTMSMYDMGGYLCHIQGRPDGDAVVEDTTNGSENTTDSGSSESDGELSTSESETDTSSGHCSRRSSVSTPPPRSRRVARWVNDMESSEEEASEDAEREAEHILARIDYSR